jgi:hypothetical protein
MRTGSHHNIISMHQSSAPAGWMPTNGEALPGFFEPDAGQLIGILGGQERPSDNTPVTFEVPPEDVDLYAMFPKDPSILYNVHYFNTSRQPTLKEGWVNIWWEDEGTRRVNWFMGLDLLQTVDLNIPPNETRDLHYAFTPSSTVRLINFFGHRHAWTPNFSSWVERKDGRVELIYQSFSWMDMPTFRYDSVVKNPAPDAQRRVDGGASGILTLAPGDELHFNCQIEFTDARALEEGAPRPATIGNLRFANQALTAEMCIGFGTTTGGVLGRPKVSAKAIPEAVGR